MGLQALKRADIWINLLKLHLQKLKLKPNHITEQILRILKNVNPLQIFAYRPCNAEMIKVLDANASSAIVQQQQALQQHQQQALHKQQQQALQHQQQTLHKQQQA